MLKKRGYRTIGLVGPGSMPHAFVTRLKEGLSGASFVDATDFIDRLKAIKSEEEIGLIKRCCEMQDAIFAKVVSTIKPGMRDIDVTALAQHEGQVRGSEQGIFLGSSAPVGQPARFAPRHFQGRTLKAGRPPGAADREQRPRRLLRRDRAHARARQGLERADRRLRGDAGGAGLHARR